MSESKEKLQEAKKPLESIEDEIKEEFAVVIGKSTPKCPPLENPADWADNNKRFLKKFMDFASSCRNAVGLAANQVEHVKKGNLLIRFFAYEIEGRWHAAIDPVIDEYIGHPKETYEGCLSWPGKKIIAQRTASIVVSYYDEDGQYFEKRRVSGFLAQVFQHEIDHLNGVEEKIAANSGTRRNLGIKPGRNDQCSCGSGKKFKKCCMQKWKEDYQGSY